VTPIPAERVLEFGKKDNFWEMGETGPCGPCSEMHIDLGPEMCDMKDVKGHKCAVNAGCARFIELWNLVFIQYNRQSGGKLVELGAKYVDTGAGLERLAAVLQNKRSNYDTDLFMPIIEGISEVTGCKYTSVLNNKIDNAFRVISDHIRSLVFSITDGATPSNEGRGYVIRRILRRASRYGRQLGMHEPFMYKLVPVVAEAMGEAFGEIRARAEFVSTVIESEEAAFGRTLDRGIEIFNGAAKRAVKSDDTISGEDAFALYDTYGFPLDLTQLMARERGLKVDNAKFDELMEQQRSRARAAQVSAVSSVSASAEVIKALPVTEDLHKYHSDSCKSEVVGFVEKKGFRAEGNVDVGGEVGIVLDKTCFYAEEGGQVGDCGVIEGEKGRFIVEATGRIADCVIHQGKVENGTLAVGDQVKAIVSRDRDSIRKNHTATHLLQWSLQEVLGKSVAQRGSLVGPDYLRFDFTWPRAVMAKQKKKVEELVRAKIAENMPVTCAVMARSEAEKLGAMALFGEKYGREVRVVAIGAEDDGKVSEAFSKEFCGGTHVDKIGDIGDFKIIKEESISAGVRRITALTGLGLSKYMEERSDIVDELSEMLKVPAEELVGRVGKLVEDNKRLAKQLKSAAKSGGSDVMAEARGLLEGCEKIGASSLIVGRLNTTSVEQGRSAIDMLKKKAKSAAIVLGFADGDNVVLLAGVTDDLIGKGLKAGDLVKEISPIVDGGGGGRPQMAQAGGKKPGKIDDALAKAMEIIKAKLGG
jgi:alanyl-tRNA synthetase